MYARLIHTPLKNAILDGGKVILLYGPRQVGKTTLVKTVLKDQADVLMINADQLIYNEVFSSRDLRKMQELIGSHRVLFIDEAQNIPDIGINLKILHDEMPDLRIIATGSSSLDLANITREPLTGRTKTFYLYPLSAREIADTHSVFELRQHLESWILYGSYPGIASLQSVSEKKQQLEELTSAYLYRDVLQLSGIKHADKVRKLLQLLALQIGSLVSFNELGQSLGMSQETVTHYIDLLEKGFVLFRLPGYSNNPRKEITKMGKVFFYDTGIRNTLINNFNPLDLRNDTGHLWENYLIVERMKRQRYAGERADGFFWRTYDRAEVDYVEVANGAVNGFEMKWKKEAASSQAWRSAYPKAGFETVNRDNFTDFIL